jgi:hypothetical protein
MPIECVFVRAMHKPWGVSDLQPWSNIDGTGSAVGELWFERADKNAPIPALLLKLLFTREPLSIQVHPDDTFARAMGMPNGKSEAWYIISAKPGSSHWCQPRERVNCTSTMASPLPTPGRFDYAKSRGARTSPRSRRRCSSASTFRSRVRNETLISRLPTRAFR